MAQAGLTHAPLWEKALEKQYPNREERSAFVKQTLESSRASLMHAWALRRLAERYPPERAALLDRESLAKLHEMAASHTVAVRREFDRTAGNLATWINLSPVPDSGTAGGAWQGSVQDLFVYVRRVDAAITTLFSKTNNDRAADEVIEDLQRVHPLLYGRLIELQKQLEKP